MICWRRRQNKLKRLHLFIKKDPSSSVMNFQWKHKNYIENRCNMMIRPFISMKSISSCISDGPQLLKPLIWWVFNVLLQKMENGKLQNNKSPLLNPMLKNRFKHILAMHKFDFSKSRKFLFRENNTFLHSNSFHTSLQKTIRYIWGTYPHAKFDGGFENRI